MSVKFASWYRKGIIAPATADPSFDPASENQAWVELEGSDRRMSHGFRILGSGGVAGLSPKAFVKQIPERGAAGFPPNQLVHVEVEPPDLPWRYTPERPDRDGRLNPWIVLVVVTENDDAAFTRESGRTCLKMTEAGVREQLPDLSQAWAWAHVECRNGRPERARMLAPRRLAPSTRYRAAVVPAREEGRLAGLGKDVDPGDILGPAWNVADPAAVELPVYADWTFETGTAGDFESLCTRLKPADTSKSAGRRVKVAYDPSLRAPAEARRFIFRGAAVPVSERRIRSDAAPELTHGLAAALAPSPEAGMDADWEWRHDPIVGPPRYGYGPDEKFLTAKAWGEELNTDPACRAAAGIGAAAVRANDERWMVELWRAAGDMATYRALVEQAKLNGHASRRWVARVGDIEKGELLQVAAPLVAAARIKGKPLAERIRKSDLPRGILLRNTMRALRPKGRLQRAAQPRQGMHVNLITTLVAETSGDAPKSLHAGRVSKANGAYVDDSWLKNLMKVADGTGGDPFLAKKLGTFRPFNRIVRPGPGEPVDDLLEIVKDTLDATNAIWSAVSKRLTIGGRGDKEISAAGVSLDSRIDTPLAGAIAATAPGLLMPGLSGFGMDRIAILDANPRYMAAVMAGANHEMRRELVWRGYPDARRQTVLRSFWRAGAEEFAPIEDWPSLHDLGRIGRRAMRGGLILLLVRGDLIRRFPNLRVRMVRARIRGGIRGPASPALEPNIVVPVDAATRLYGFEDRRLDAAAAIGDRTTRNAGWYVVFEQSRRDSRFGLQAEPDKGPVRSWDDLSWPDVSGTADGQRSGFIDVGTPQGLGAIEDVAEWGRNGADFARILLRRPYRLFVHAESLLGN